MCLSRAVTSGVGAGKSPLRRGDQGAFAVLLNVRGDQ